MLVKQVRCSHEGLVSLHRAGQAVLLVKEWMATVVAVLQIVLKRI
jgi:hypothetical protein